MAFALVPPSSPLHLHCSCSCSPFPKTSRLSAVPMRMLISMLVPTPILHFFTTSPTCCGDLPTSVRRICSCLRGCARPYPATCGPRREVLGVIGLCKGHVGGWWCFCTFVLGFNRSFPSHAQSLPRFAHILISQPSIQCSIQPVRAGMEQSAHICHRQPRCSHLPQPTPPSLSTRAG